MSVKLTLTHSFRLLFWWFYPLGFIMLYF